MSDRLALAAPSVAPLVAGRWEGGGVSKLPHLNAGAWYLATGRKGQDSQLVDEESGADDCSPAAPPADAGGAVLDAGLAGSFRPQGRVHPEGPAAGS